MRSGFRFDPPQVEASAELRWLLWRAFGPAGEVLTGVADLDKQTVMDLARRFDLAATGRGEDAAGDAGYRARVETGPVVPSTARRCCGAIPAGRAGVSRAGGVGVGSRGSVGLSQRGGLAARRKSDAGLAQHG